MEICEICNEKYPSLWVCENCDTEHCPSCSIEDSEGTGEYPDEDAYSICSKCNGDEVK